jgi:hypothetical protein
MGVSALFTLAKKRIGRLEPNERETLTLICRDIRSAEQQLLANGAGTFRRCVERCEGLCCRNVLLDAILSVWDFVFLLGADPALGESIAACGKRENPLFTSDCVFLKDGVGPCILPFDLRPEVCITAFCGNARALRPDVAQVKRGFWRLRLFFYLRGLRCIRRAAARRVRIS